MVLGASMVAQQTNVLATVLVFHMDAGSSPDCSTFNPAPCFSLAKYWRMDQVLGPLLFCGRTIRGPWLPAVD